MKIIQPAFFGQMQIDLILVLKDHNKGEIHKILT